MQQRYPLSALAVLVAAARESRSATRLSIRNNERFGVVHLYFQHGQVVRVEGHHGTGIASLEDIATWQNATLRLDELAAVPEVTESAAALTAALAATIQTLERNGALAPVEHRPGGPSAPHAVPGAAAVSPAPATAPRLTLPSLPSPQMPGPSLASRPSLPESEPPAHVPRGVTGLPPLPVASPDAAAVARPSWPTSWPGSTTHETVDDKTQLAQWQLLVLALHQVLERASTEMGRETAGGLLWQALAHVRSTRPFLANIELDLDGWVSLKHEEALAELSRFEVVDSIAALLTEYETRCITLVGPDRARRMILEGTARLRDPLSQLGLVVAPI